MLLGAWQIQNQRLGKAGYQDIEVILWNVKISVDYLLNDFYELVAR